ncbi:hypothetical protein GGQ92_003031 [Gracilibacillus halotolerans]|uniref:DUF3885 domain-containing protein n=1 Tax=Gracilibacillus halotolerans TaxID=74386 RepID=A0A841RNY1_9BACI|nr:DUF3885 domain-containing protein [Gracilibacillus halotolerans]MBB6514209.1 hypothetical protein [Gracilibacillus halotolerans]
MELQDYLNTNFPGLVLKPSLYSQWNNRLHFELAKGLYQMNNRTDELNQNYFNAVYNQALTLFNMIFSDEDTMFLVTNIHQTKQDTKKSIRKMKVYRHYIKNKTIRFQLRQKTVSYLLDEEDYYFSSQFSLECKKQDISYPLLIKAICNQDFSSLKPTISTPDYSYNPEVFFINVTKNVIFYIYDDRGCEIIATNKEIIRLIYKEYSDWIDEDSRKEIDEQFVITEEET